MSSQPQQEQEQEWLCQCCSKPCTLRCSQCKAIHFCSRDCQKEIWKSHKAFCKRVSQPVLSPSPNNEPPHSTCLIIDGMGPCGAEWEDTKGARQELLAAGLNVITIDASKGSQIPEQVASLLQSQVPPVAFIMFGFGSGGDGSDEKFIHSPIFQDALQSWCRAGGRFMVQGERTSYMGHWPKKWFDKDWKDASYFRTDHKCFAVAESSENTTTSTTPVHWCEWYKHAKGAVTSGYNVKACMLENVDPTEILFGTMDGATSYSLVPHFGGQEIGGGKVAVAFGKYGDGTVSFFGDVNHESTTLRIMAVIARGY